MCSPLNLISLEDLSTYDAWQRYSRSSIATIPFHYEIPKLSVDPVRQALWVNPLTPRHEVQVFQKSLFGARLA